MTKLDITRLFAYTEWANHLILDAATALNDDQMHHDFQTGQHSVLETLAHMLGAEWIWLERWVGHKYANLGGFEAPFKIEGATLEQLRIAWSEIETNRRDLLNGLTEEALHAPVVYKNILGKEFRQPLVDQMQHVANHASHHRGQIVGFLRALGATPPTTDMIHYYRSVE